MRAQLATCRCFSFRVRCALEEPEIIELGIPIRRACLLSMVCVVVSCATLPTTGDVAESLKQCVLASARFQQDTGRWPDNPSELARFAKSHDLAFRRIRSIRLVFGSGPGGALLVEYHAQTSEGPGIGKITVRRE